MHEVIQLPESFFNILLVQIALFLFDLATTIDRTISVNVSLAARVERQEKHQHALLFLNMLKRHYLNSYISRICNKLWCVCVCVIIHTFIN